MIFIKIILLGINKIHSLNVYICNIIDVFYIQKMESRQLFEAMYQAVQEGQLENLQKYVKQGGIINEALLIYSIINKQKDILVWLLSVKKIITEKMVYQAVHDGQIDILNLLLSYKEKLGYAESLIYTVKNNKLEILKLLLQAGADINYNNCECLQQAALQGDLQLVEYLLDHGANVFCRLDEAYQIASIKRHNHILKVLNKYRQSNNKINQDTINQYNQTASTLKQMYSINSF